jgi:hypothetical protein
MMHAAGRRDPIGERVISAMSRQDTGAHLRDLLRSLAPSEAQVVAARYLGIPGAVVAESFGTSVRGIDKIEQRAAAELASQPTLFTDLNALLSLKNFVEDRVSGVLEEFLLDETLPATVHIKDYLRQREQRCKVCGRPVRYRPIAVDATARASRRRGIPGENGRPREYCSNRCRQRAYRGRKRVNSGDRLALTDDPSTRPA